MAIIFESTLVGYPYTSSNLGIRLGQQIKGSLTSVTDISDDYNLIINEKKLVNLKFNVEQTVTEFDFYTIKTPVGSFRIHPLFKFPTEGINFYVSPNDNYRDFNYYDSIDIDGSNNGVFRLSYFLEINEILDKSNYNLIEPGDKFTDAPVISANKNISAWHDYNDYIKVSSPTLPSGSSGTLIAWLTNVTDYDSSPNSFPQIDVTFYNEGQRNLSYGTFTKTDNYLSATNLSTGDYYIKIQLYKTGNSYPLLYTFNIGFYELFSNNKTIARNSDKEDYFSDWLGRLDSVIYSKSFSDYKITPLNTNASQLGLISVADKVSNDLDKMQVERVVFSDKTIAFDFSAGEAGYKTVMLIGAAFGKEFISQYFSTGLKYFDSGSSTKSIAKLIVDLNLIEQSIGNYSDSSWVKHVYKNIIGIDPVQSEENYYVNLLKNKTYTRTDLLDMAVTVSNLESRIDLVGLQTNGLVFDTLS
jgi:hypothetical protein